MKIQVLGSGCPTCKKLYEMAKSVAEEIGNSTTVDYVTGPEGLQKIIELGVMSSPVLVIDGQVAMVGFSPDIEKIKQKIHEHL